MDYLLAEKIKDWRRKKAQEEGGELFRIMSNKTIDEIAEKKPKNKSEFLEVKGIKDRKFAKYGEELLELMSGESSVLKPVKTKVDILTLGDIEGDGIYSVSRYLDFLNSRIKYEIVKIKGEISSIDIRDSYLFFSLKDKTDESVLECFMWKRDYDVFGIDLKEGMEIIVEGFSNIRKQTGRFNFQVSAIELVGEGVLKKAYEELKKKLEKEGLFSDERKKPIPDLVQNIGLITSEKGAVINDFLNNLGKYGFKISFFNSKVEGAMAVRDLIRGIDYFSDKAIDVLIIIRGGGSLESLQAFNNEVLVRKISDFNKPVVCGIGHDKDVVLVDFVVDKSVSTPTAVAKFLNKSWERIALEMNNLARDIFYKQQLVIFETKNRFSKYLVEIVGSFDSITKSLSNILDRLRNHLKNIEQEIGRGRARLKEDFDSIINIFSKRTKDLNVYLSNTEKQLDVFNPLNQLKLGFSLVVSRGKIIKSISQIKKGDEIDIQLSDGKIKSVVEKVLKRDE